jgi:hypothetical protein
VRRANPASLELGQVEEVRASLMNESVPLSVFIGPDFGEQGGRIPPLFQAIFSAIISASTTPVAPTMRRVGFMR